MKYQVILADPPWWYSGDMVTGARSTDHYPSMKLNQLMDLKVHEICDSQCVLYMWSTGPQMANAIQLGEAWGFQYRQVAFVWNKQRPICGNYTITQCEFVLVFRPKRGKLPKRAKYNVRQYLEEKPREHSRKPEYVRDMLNLMYPGIPKLEMFARSTREGWDSFGNETTKFD